MPCSRWPALRPSNGQQLGAAGRRKVEREFCQSIVIERYLAAVAAKIADPGDAAMRCAEALQLDRDL